MNVDRTNNVLDINDKRQNPIIDNQSKYAKLAEYVRANDYEGIFSLDLRHMTMVRIDEVPFELIAAEIVAKCPYEIKCKHPLKLLRFAYELHAGGLADEFDALMDEIMAIIPSLPLPKSEKQHLMGEWMIISTLPDSRSIRIVVEKYEKAAMLMHGKSLVIDASDPITVANGLVGYYLLTPGLTEEVAPLIARVADLYSGFTGELLMGMDILFEATIAYYRGNFDEAQPLAYKAAYMLETTKQDILQISAGELMAQIATCQGDIACFGEALDYMRKAVERSINCLPCSGLEALVRSGLLNTLGGHKNTPDWIKSFSIVKGEYGTGPYGDKNVAGNLHYAPAHFSLACLYHSIYLFESGQYARAFAVADTMQKALNKSNSVFILDCYFSLMTAGCYLELGKREKALALVEKAVMLALPDGFYMLLTFCSRSLEGLVESCLQKHDAKALKKVCNISKAFINGIKTLKPKFVEAELPESLSKREKDVALLASRSMRNADIAKTLGISLNTVKVHLKSVYSKLGIDKRSEIWGRLK